MALAGGGTRWFARTGKSQSLILHSQPDDRSPSVLLASPSCEGPYCIDVEGITRRGEWQKVAARQAGVVASGRVRTRFLARIPDSLGIPHSVECSGNDGNAIGGTFYPSGTRKRSARLKAGTPIYWFARDGSAEAWATVPQERVFQVMYTDGKPWAELVEIPGVTPAQDVYVRTSALIFET